MMQILSLSQRQQKLASFCQETSYMFATFLEIRFVDPLGPGQTAVCLFRYENCEMRTVILSDTSGESGGLDPLFFPGGHSIKGLGNEPVQSHKGPAT